MTIDPTDLTAAVNSAVDLATDWSGFYLPIPLLWGSRVVAFQCNQCQGWVRPVHIDLAAGLCHTCQHTNQVTRYVTAYTTTTPAKTPTATGERVLRIIAGGRQ